MERPERVGVAKHYVLTQTVIEKCDLVKHPIKNLSSEILIMKKENWLVTSETP